KGDTLDLRFVPISADVQTGDELVTSGLDGVYPPGLPVAKVVRVDKQADTAFARVICLPVAPVRGARQLLVLHYQNNVPPRPAEEPDAATTAKDAKAKKGGKAADSKAAVDKSAAKPAEKQATPAKPAEKPSAKTAAAEKKAAGEKKPAAEKAEKNTKPPATPGAQP
ncbi:rod shape-determining protein MreC, partial [Paraburkholderia fungorum]